MKTTLFRLVPLLSGLLFGMGMAFSGMIDPQKVLGFLDVAGQWDPSLAFVMGGALMVFMPCYFIYVKRRTHSIDGAELSVPPQSNVTLKLIVGSVLFGVGWGIAGICPGPAAASLALGNTDILLFVVAMLAGSMAAKVLTMNARKALQPIKA